MKTERTPGVESARRALQILLMFNETTLEVTIDDVINEFKISQTSAYRYLSLLRELHLIQHRGKGKYVLGARINQLTAASEDVVDLGEIATPTLKELSEQTNETAFLMTRVRNEAVFIKSWQPDRSLALSFHAGRASHLHRGAVAKILLAYSSRELQKRYLERFVDAHEHATLAQQLADIRKQGYAVSLAEVDEGTWGGAVPVFVDGHVIASLSVAGPEFRIPQEKQTAILAALRGAAQRLSTELQLETGQRFDDQGV